MRQANHSLSGAHRLYFVLLAAFLMMSHFAFSQTSFTRTYQLGGGIEVACCAKGPMSWGFTPVIQDTSLSGNVQITSISVSDSGNILATDPHGVAGTTWEIFVGNASCGFPAGEVQGVVNLGTYSCSAPTQLIFNTNGVFSPPASGTFAASFDFTTGTFTANDLGAFILGTNVPSNLTQGLFVQVMLWGGDNPSDLILSDISVTVAGTVGTAGLIPQQLLGASGSSTNPTASYAEPVNTATGNYYSSFTDLAVPGRGFPFVFSRHYNTLDSYSGPLGPGWTHSYNLFLTQDPASGAVTIKQQDGSSVKFALNGPGSFIAVTTGLFDKLQENADGSFTLTRRNQVKLIFSPAGKLTSVGDRNGNTQFMTYDSSGDLTAITDTVGRVFTLSYNENHQLVSISDPSGRTVFYAYDAKGNLVSCANPAGGVTQYAYDSSARLTAAINPRGVTYVHNTFDASGRVVAQQNGRGITTSFFYDAPVAGMTTIIDGNGNTLYHVYDANTRLIKTVNGKGAAITLSYDSNNDRTAITDANGHATFFTYDSNGNVTKVLNALGSAVSFAFDPFNDVTGVTDPVGHVTVFTYDSNGNLSSILDPLGGTSRLSYDSQGQLLAITDTVGNTRKFVWDNFGNRTQFVDGAGRMWTFTYDALGRKTTSMDSLGHTNSIHYDVLDRIVSKINPLGDQNQYAYDPVGELVTATDANRHVTSYQYDSVGKLAAMIDALGNQTTYAYDFDSNLVSVRNARGKITSYSYDAANERIAITDPLGRTTTFTNDPAGNLISEAYGNGKSKTISYDAASRPVMVNYSDGTTVSFVFDAIGNRTSMTDSLGVTSCAFDALNRLTSVTGIDGKVVGYAYNAAGKPSTLTYPDGRTIYYQYDGSNRLIGVADGAHMGTSYEYDRGARLVSVRLPNGVQASYVYDNANRLLKVLNASRFAYISSYSYALDKVGNRIKIVSGRYGASTYAYDALNQLTSFTDSWSHTVNYVYDEDGNRSMRMSREGAELYTYDDGDELISAGRAAFTYDGSGNRLSRVNLGATTSYTWDAANRLKSVTDQYRIIEYAYDGDGNRVSESSVFGSHAYVNNIQRRAPEVIADYRGDKLIDYVYGYHLIAAVKDSDADYVTYDGVGSVVDTTEADGAVVASYAYDPWGKSTASRERFGEGGEDHESTPTRFAGQVLDEGDDLYYMRARYYDPQVGRFLSFDPIGPSVGNPHDQNGYAYARNNPLRYVDPLGLSSEASATPDVTSGARVYKSSSSSSTLGTLITGPLGAFNPFNRSPNPLNPSNVKTDIVVASVATGVYLAPEVESFCLFEPGACVSLTTSAAELGLGVGGSPSLTGAVSNADAVVSEISAVVGAIKYVIDSNISFDFGPSDPGTIYPGPTDVVPTVYPDPNDPSGVSYDNPNIDTSDDGSDGGS